MTEQLKNYLTYAERLPLFMQNVAGKYKKLKCTLDYVAKLHKDDNNKNIWLKNEYEKLQQEYDGFLGYHCEYEHALYRLTDYMDDHDEREKNKKERTKIENDRRVKDLNDRRIESYEDITVEQC